MVGDAFRIAAFCYSYNLLRSLKSHLLDYLEVSDDIDCCLRCDQCELVQLFKQAENGLYVRMAIISYLLGHRPLK